MEARYILLGKQFKFSHKTIDDDFINKISFTSRKKNNFVSSHTSTIEERSTKKEYKFEEEKREDKIKKKLGKER